VITLRSELCVLGIRKLSRSHVVKNTYLNMAKGRTKFSPHHNFLATVLKIRF